MKSFYRILTLSLSYIFIASTISFAGNNERSGQAGAYELRINPWARSSGWGGLNTANVKGLEASTLNIAGMAFTERSEVIFSHADYLRGTDISINAFGLSQKVGESGVIGVLVNSMNFGDINITTEDQPEGGIGTYSPQFLNFGFGYSREFSNSIYGGIMLRAIQETISNAQAQGVSIDAGVQYVTGARKQAKFGIALRNIGPKMRVEGDGLSFQAQPQGGSYNMTVQNRSQDFELPSLLNIGLSYVFELLPNHSVTAVGNFTSNSFSNDQIGVGAEYAFKSYFMVRGGYKYENGGSDIATSTDVHTGLTAGATIEIPVNEAGSTFGFDYSFRETYAFGGTHTIGARLTLR